MVDAAALLQAVCAFRANTIGLPLLIPYYISTLLTTDSDPFPEKISLRSGIRCDIRHPDLKAYVYVMRNNSG